MTHPLEGSRVKGTIDSWLQEAQEVLRKYGLPTDYDGLGKIEGAMPDQLALNAQLVVNAYYWLEKELKRGRAERAVEYMHELAAAYEEMFLMNDVPELAGDTGVIFIDDLIKSARAGMRSILGGRRGGRSTPAARVKQWQKKAEQLKRKNLNLSTSEIARRIAGRGESPNTIRKKIKI